MKSLTIRNPKPTDLTWLIEAVEGKASGNTSNAIFKGQLMVGIATLMEEKETPPKKPNLKEVEK